jgi:hypothetical protein
MTHAIAHHTYTTIGSVRGCCGHDHRSIGAAQRCLARDARGCRAQGGYSDRYIVRDDGRIVYVDGGVSAKAVIA